MNVDWFQPYTHVCDSVGAIYLIIQNLPRSERYKWENMILVGLIPGPKEPNFTINSSKFVMNFWIGNDILTKQGLSCIETCVAQPRSVGRLPTKISSGFAGFSADQWRNWTLIYSVIALCGVLPPQHLQYWLLFVKACTLLCT